MTEATPSTPTSDTVAATTAAAPTKPVQSPLTLIMTLKSAADYEQLNALLLHMQSLPPTENPIAVALGKIGTVHFARFVFLENNTKLAVITTYDGDFEIYINDFVNEIGDIFNVHAFAHDGRAAPAGSKPSSGISGLRESQRYTSVAAFIQRVSHLNCARYSSLVRSKLINVAERDCKYLHRH